MTGGTRYLQLGARKNEAEQLNKLAFAQVERAEETGNPLKLVGAADLFWLAGELERWRDCIKTAITKLEQAGKERLAAELRREARNRDPAGS